MEASLNTPVHICKQFNAFNVTYILQSEKMTSESECEPTAFDMLMSSANKKFTPDKILVNNNYDRLMNSLISYMEENKLGWSNDIVTTTGTP